MAIVALVASVNVSAGELDGKAIWCDWVGQYSKPVMYEFRNDTPVPWVVIREGTKIVIKEASMGGTISEYRAEPSVVTWAELFGTYTLNRKTLELSFDNLGDPPVKASWECEALSSLDNLKARLEELRSERQKAVDKEMKGNKI